MKGRFTFSFSVFCRSAAHLLPESLSEEGLGVETYNVRNLGNRVMGGFQEMFGFINPFIYEIMDGGGVEMFLEHMNQIILVQIGLIGQSVQGDGL